MKNIYLVAIFTPYEGFNLHDALAFTTEQDAVQTAAEKNQELVSFYGVNSVDDLLDTYQVRAIPLYR